MKYHYVIELINTGCGGTGSSGDENLFTINDKYKHTKYIMVVYRLYNLIRIRRNSKLQLTELVVRVFGTF